MDIMRPKLQRIGNMCFRRLDLPNDGIVDDLNDESFYIETNSKDNTEIDNKVVSKSIDALEEESNEDIEDISEGNGNRFRGQIEIAKFFHKFIVGSRAEHLKSIEYQSRCHIKVPSQADQSCLIAITGNSKEDINYAINKIKATVMRARNRSDFTHFVSIPFNDSSICERFISFKTQILNDKQINEGIDDSLFQIKNKLHLTVVPILLTDQRERDSASKILDDCHNHFIKGLINGKPIRIELKGIDYMNDDPTEVNVIYAKVNDISDNPCLQSIVDHLFVKFEESGLIRTNHLPSVDSESKVKLHVTLMNTSFRKREDSGRERRRQQNKQYFNASGILNKFKDYYFGQICVKTIEISIRYTNKGKDGYYSHTSRIDF